MNWSLPGKQEDTASVYLKGKANFTCPGSWRQERRMEELPQASCMLEEDRIWSQNQGNNPMLLPDPTGVPARLAGSAHRG